MLNPQPDKWTIVLVGQWNPRIFSPEWVGRNLLDGESVVVELVAAPTVHLLRFATDDLLIAPSNDRLVIGVKRINEATLNRAEEVAKRALRKLHHTPVTAIGVNLGYIDADPDDVGLFELNDISGLSGIGAQLIQTEVVRKVSIDDQVINIKHVLGGGGRELNLNFHHDAVASEEHTSAQEAADWLCGRASSCDVAANQILDSYGMEIEQEEE